MEKWWQMQQRPDKPEQPYQPVFNVPGAVTALLAIMFAVHLLRLYALGEDANRALILQFAFIPVFFTPEAFEAGYGWSRIFTPVTHAFLHANWMHLLFNSFWLLAFGGVCAKRLGNQRFMVLFVTGVVVGALFQFLVTDTSRLIMIGASAGVSACFGAASRFALSISGDQRRKLLSFTEVWSDRTALGFIAVWLVANLLFGSNILGSLFPGSGGVFGETAGQIAWQAHVGGFVAGILMIGWIDPRNANQA